MKELRMFDFEVRAEQNEEHGHFLTGRPIVFGQRTNVGMFDEVTAQAVFTPGHSPSCVTWVVDDTVFTGDSYIPGIKTVTIFPHADKALVYQSEALILDLLKHRTIYPGHSITEEEQII